ncbi:MAG: hypothetical protein IT565_02995 [Rhodospirillales bacterium]|nr:hypothetical protein [Rhodospirillales bacterium]
MILLVQVFAALLAAFMAFAVGRSVLLWAAIGFLLPPAAAIVAFLPDRGRPLPMRWLQRLAIRAETWKG